LDFYYSDGCCSSVEIRHMRRNHEAPNDTIFFNNPHYRKSFFFQLKDLLDPTHLEDPELTQEFTSKLFMVENLKKIPLVFNHFWGSEFTYLDIVTPIISDRWRSKYANSSTNRIVISQHPIYKYLSIFNINCCSIRLATRDIDFNEQ